MKDNILAGTGNSRYLKTSIPAGTTWNEALVMLRNGNFPIDLNGINNEGFTQVGTPLDKANMLPDALAESVGMDGNATLATFLAVLANLLTLTDEATGDKYLMSMSVTDDGFPALTLTKVS